MVAASRPACPVCSVRPALARLLPVLLLCMVLLPVPAGAVSTLVVFSANGFMGADGPVEGGVRGTLEVEDLDGNGTITAREVRGFSFFAEFVDMLLGGSGDLASHAVFDIPGVTGTPVMLAPGLGTDGLGFIDTGGFPGLPGGVGGLSLLTIADGVLGIARADGSGPPSLVSAVSSNLDFTSRAPVPVPLPGAMGLLLAGLAGLGVGLLSRPGRSRPAKG